MQRMTVGLIVGMSIAAVLGLAAQSPTPFGIPSADQPTPAATIPAVPGSRAQGWLAQGRSEVLARHGVVATSDPLAAQAGLEILRRGGNAIDAAVAAGAVLDVTSQNDTGIGGDLFALVWSARDKKLYALASAGWAPAGWTPQFFTDRLRVKSVPSSGVNAATVPGAIAGYDALLKKFGTRGFKETFEPAARIAEEGWGLAERRHDDLRGAVKGLLADPDSRQTFLAGDAAPPLYSIIRNPGLAKALRLIQQHGTRRVLPRRDRRSDREEGPGERRRDEPRGPRRVPAGMGRADHDQLSRLRHLPAAAAGTGDGGARDAEHPRGVRAEAGVQPDEARSRRSDATGTCWSRRRSWPTPTCSRRTPTRSSRPCRSRSCCRSQYAATLCDRIKPDRASKPGVTGRHRRRHHLPDHRRPLGQHGVAHPQRVQRLRQPRDRAAVRFRAAQPRRRLLARPEEPERRRAAQASVPHDHRRLRDEGRPAADDVRQHGRQRPARDARAAHGQPDRSSG